MILVRRSLKSKIALAFILVLLTLIIIFQRNESDSYIKDLKSQLQSFSSSSSSSSNNNNNIPLFNLTKSEIKSLNSVTSNEFLKGNKFSQLFFHNFFDIVLKNEMSYPLKRRQKLDGSGKPHIDNVHFKNDPNEIISEDFLLNLFDFPNDFINDLTIKHKNIINSLPENFVPNFYKGNGYAIVGGGKYSWFSLLAVKCLRNTGAVLPVEIILPNNEDYDPLLCETLLPQLNAKCINLENIFGKEKLENMKISGYQLKSLALIASSFKNVFLMDSDSYVVNNPEHLFKSEIFKSTHMLSWPDFWRRTTSPIYYKIAGLNITNEPVRHLNDIFTDVKLMHLTDKENYNIFYDLNYHDRGNTLIDWSSESGQLLINKDIHFRTLLLAFYYNRDGPFGYHPLLSQGGAGEGDKETFVAAAHRLNLPYYQVYKKSDGTFGFWNFLNSWEHGAIIQYDPVKDWENVESIKLRIKHDIKKQGDNFKYDYKKYFIDQITVKNSKPLFYHCHDPKFDPFAISDRRAMFVRDKNGQITERRRRMLGHDFPRNKVDLELSLWEISNDYICKQNIHFSSFGDSNKDNLCNVVIPAQLEFLKKSNKYITEHYDPENSDENLAGSNDIFGEDKE